MATTPHPDKDSLIRLLRQHHAGEPWLGPSRAALLRDVTAEVAAWHPGAGAHSIWETVLHMRSWTDEVRERAAGKVPDRTAEPVGGDWPSFIGGAAAAAVFLAFARLDEFLPRGPAGREPDEGPVTGILREVAEGIGRPAAYVEALLGAVLLPVSERTAQNTAPRCRTFPRCCRRC